MDESVSRGKTDILEIVFRCLWGKTQRIPLLTRGGDLRDSFLKVLKTTDFVVGAGAEKLFNTNGFQPYKENTPA